MKKIKLPQERAVGVGKSNQESELVYRERESSTHIFRDIIKKNKYLNKKAGISYFQIVVLIISVFAISYLIYSSDSVSAESGFGICCEETISGNSCQNAPAEKCNQDFNAAPTECENTGFCKIGCCISPNNGICNKRASKRDCEKMNGKFVEDSLCNVQECEEGCCFLGDETKWTTEKNCEWEGNSENKDIPTDFRVDENHNTWLKCLFSAEKETEGACIYESENKKKCVYTTLEGCVSRTGSETNFARDKYCSDSELGTVCKSKDHKGCVENEEDVYWFDSCDNKEGVADNCNLYEGSYCGKKGENYICKDINCIVDGKKRKNGESWCEYDGAIGVETENDENAFGRDPAGSRHVRHICYFGTERIEPCADFRNEICVQEDSTIDREKFSQATCRVNQWRSCLDYNRGEGGDKMVNKCKKNPDCFVKHVAMAGSFDFKVCLPKYPPGFELNQEIKEEEYDTFSTPADGICSTATLRCTETWQCGIFGCFCVDNCKCHTGYFTEKMNEFCVSLGDCGAYINYIGDATGDGYTVKGAPRISEGSYKKYAQADPNQKPAEPGDMEFLSTLNPENLKEIPEDWKEKNPSNLSSFEKELLGVAGAFGSPLLLKMFDEDSDNETGWLNTIGMGSVNYAGFTNSFSSTKASIAAQIEFEGREAKDFSAIAALIAGLIAYIITQSILFTMIAALLGFLFGIGWIIYVNIDFTCMPWEPPAGGDKCNECNKLEVPCSEYRCESLGQLCEFINKGSENELCISKPKNENPPEINPLYSVIAEGFGYSNVNENGFEIIDLKNQGCIDAYTSVKFGIKVEPFARCRIGTDPKQNYEEMGDVFGIRGNNLLPIHKMDLFFPSPEAFKNQYNLTEEQKEKLGKLEYYVKCKTASGKINPKPYVIKSCVKPGPDLTAPRINPYSKPINKAYIKYGEEKQNLLLYVNEPSECKWSEEDKDYNSMENNLNCETDLGKYTVYGLPCNTTLTNLQNNSRFYIKCKDQPWFAGTENETNRNVMEKSYVYELSVSKSELEIDELRPRDGEEIVSGFEPVSVKLRLTTSGGAEDGKAKCEWEGNGYSDEFVYEENSSILHEYELTNAMRGKYNITFTCEDIARNTATAGTSFKINIDSFGPKIIRVYYDSGLKITTSEKAKCKYSFDRKFSFENATEMYGDSFEHFGDWQFKTYYIQCKDEYDNKGGKIKIKAYEVAK